MECAAYLYWEDEHGKSYTATISAYLPGIDRVGQEYTLYGYEEETPHIRSNRFVVTSLKYTRSAYRLEYRLELKLIEKQSYQEAIKLYPDIIEQ